MIRPCTLIFTILSAVCQFALAKPTSFQEHNFSIQLPEGWKAVEPLPPQTTAFVRSPDGSKGIIIMTLKVSPEKMATASQVASNEAKEAAIKAGCKIDNEKDITVNGVIFRTYTIRMTNGVSVVSYTGSAGTTCYAVQGFNNVADAGSDPDISASLKSFNLLVTPPKIPAETKTHKN